MLRKVWPVALLCSIVACSSGDCLVGSDTDSSSRISHGMTAWVGADAAQPVLRLQTKLLMPMAPKAELKDIEIRHEVYVLTDAGCMERHKICDVTATADDLRWHDNGYGLYAPSCTAERSDFEGRKIERFWIVYFPRTDEPKMTTAESVSDEPGLNEDQAFHLRLTRSCPEYRPFIEVP